MSQISVKTNKWVRDDLDIENIIKVLRINKIGIPYVRDLLTHPEFNSVVLLERRAMLSALHKDYLDSIRQGENDNFIDRNIQILNENVDDLLWFYEEHNQETIDYYNTLFFTWFSSSSSFSLSNLSSYLNSSSFLLHITTISKIYVVPLLTLLGPFLSSFIPIIAMKWYGLDISYALAFKIIWQGLILQIKTAMNAILNGKNPFIILAVVLYLIFYIYGIWTTIKTSLDQYSILMDIQRRVASVRNFLENMRMILFDARNVYFQSPMIVSEIEHLYSELTEDTIGANLKIFKTLATPLTTPLHRSELSIKDSLRIVIDYARKISGTLCLSRLLRIPGFSLPSWYSHETPVIDIKGLRHPMLDSAIAVPNDIRLVKNLLITGPNQAGKSTFMRALLIAVWMAQTVGIVRADSYESTPFKLIYSYIGITDEVGRESLFEAEMNAVYEYLHEIDKIKNQAGGAICFFDELFTSTNHEEGLSAALSVGSFLERNPRNITVISSHFSELSRLKFDKICFDIMDSHNNKLKFTYRIRPGISQDRVALRLMKEKGYNIEIVSEAYKNLKELFPISVTRPSNLSLEAPKSEVSTTVTKSTTTTPATMATTVITAAIDSKNKMHSISVPMDAKIVATAVMPGKENNSTRRDKESKKESQEASQRRERGEKRVQKDDLEVNNAALDSQTQKEDSKIEKLDPFDLYQ